MNITKIAQYLIATDTAKDMNGDDVKVGDKVKFTVLIAYRKERGIRPVKKIVSNSKIEVYFNGMDNFRLDSHEFQKV